MIPDETFTSNIIAKKFPSACLSVHIAIKTWQTPFITTFTPRSYVLVTGLQRGPQAYGRRGLVRQLLMPCYSHLPNRLCTSPKHAHEKCFHGASHNAFFKTVALGTTEFDAPVNTLHIRVATRFSKHRRTEQHNMFTPQNKLDSDTGEWLSSAETRGDQCDTPAVAFVADFF